MPITPTLKPSPPRSPSRGSLPVAGGPGHQGALSLHGTRRASRARGAQGPALPEHLDLLKPSSTRDNFLSPGTLPSVCRGRVPLVSGGRGCTKHPGTHRMAPAREDEAAPNVSPAEAEKLL